MKKFLMPLLVLVIAAIISAVLYFVRIEIHKDWQTTIGTITNIEIKTTAIVVRLAVADGIYTTIGYILLIV